MSLKGVWERRDLFNMLLEKVVLTTWLMVLSDIFYCYCKLCWLYNFQHFLDTFIPFSWAEWNTGMVYRDRQFMYQIYSNYFSSHFQNLLLPTWSKMWMTREELEYIVIEALPFIRSLFYCSLALVPSPPLLTQTISSSQQALNWNEPKAFGNSKRWSTDSAHPMNKGWPTFYLWEISNAHTSATFSSNRIMAAANYIVCVYNVCTLSYDEMCYHTQHSFVPVFHFLLALRMMQKI